MLRISFFLLFTHIIWCPFTLAQSNEWQIESDLEDLKVYSQSVETSNLKRLKIEMWFTDTKLSEIVAVMADGSSYTDWLYKCTHAETVQRIHSMEKIDYFQLDFPWPLSDRDIYSHAISTYDAQTGQLLIASDALDTFPPTDGFVRITDAKTQWNFYPQDNDTIYLEYYTSPDPGGSIPTWLVNMVIDKGPTKTMLRFRELVKAQKGIAPTPTWMNQ